MNTFLTSKTPFENPHSVSPHRSAGAFLADLPLPARIAVLVPPVLVVILIARYSVNVPFGDQWALVPLIQSYLDGTLSVSDFWSQHNEHRIVVSKLILMTLAIFSHWNTFYELYANVVVSSLTFLCLVLLIQHTSREVNERFFVFWSLCGSWLLFSTRQWTNWLSGFQIAWFLTSLALVITIWALTLWPRRLSKLAALTVAIISSIVGTFSLVNGLLIWIVGGILVWASHGGSAYFLVWISSAALTVTVYFMNYSGSDVSELLLYLAQHPLEHLHYLVAYLGTSLSSSLIISTMAGSVLLGMFVTSCIYLVRHHRTHLELVLPWIAIALFALLTASMTALGRVVLEGVNQANASRYATVSILFTLSTVITFSVALHAHVKRFGALNAWQRASVRVIAVLLLASFLEGYIKGIKKFGAVHVKRVEIRNCLYHMHSAPEACLTQTYPDVQMLRDRAGYLMRIGWGGFRQFSGNASDGESQQSIGPTPEQIPQAEYH